MEIDPLLKDLSEKKQNFRRSVVSLASELKDVRNQLASQEKSFTHETLTRKMAESKAMNMELEVGRLQKCLEEKNDCLQKSAATSDQVCLFGLPLSDAGTGATREENRNTNTWGNGRMNRGVPGAKYGDFLMD